MGKCPTLALAVLAAASPAGAEVRSASDRGFVSHNEVLVDGGSADVWVVMLRPADWWSPGHTYSGDAANMTIEAEAGGCFCEAIPEGGRVEHMRVIHLAPGSMLRMAGALGPLQSEAVTGVLTMTLEPEGGQIRIVWDYVVGGFMRMPMAEAAPLVDQVIGEQLLRLAARLGRPWDGAPRRL